VIDNENQHQKHETASTEEQTNDDHYTLEQFVTASCEARISYPMN
jgi:hypothetical protein